MYILSYSNLAHMGDIPARSRLAGSASLRHDGQFLHVKKHEQRPPEIKGNIYKNYLQTVKYAQMLGIPISASEVDNGPKRIHNFGQYITRYQELRNAMYNKKVVPKRAYKLNKAKVRKRAIAMCRLSKSKQFLAFYSISFPSGAGDKILYEIFNKWLTNCRTRYGLTTYLWVAEKQQNGTLHFHLLTNCRMDISKVNKAMANSIDTSVNQGKLTWGQSSRTLYNGVDVDSVQKPKKRQNENREHYRNRMKEYQKHSIANRVKFAVGYLTKYITKNDYEFEHLPFHCSRDVSQLFSSIVLDAKDAGNFMRYLSDDADDYEIINIDTRTIFIFKKTPPQKLYAMLDSVNDLVYIEYHRQREKHEQRPRKIDIGMRMFL